MFELSLEEGTQIYWCCNKDYQFITHQTAVWFDLYLHVGSHKTKRKEKKYLSSFLVTSLHYEKTKELKKR